MKVAIGDDRDSGEYFIRQFEGGLTPASFAPPAEWPDDEIVDIPENVLLTYIALRSQDATMQLLLAHLLDRKERP